MNVNKTVCDLCKKEKFIPNAGGNFNVYYDGVQLHNQRIDNGDWHTLANVDICDRCLQDDVIPFLLSKGLQC